MSATWQWAKANPDAAARRIRELERENAALREALRQIKKKTDPTSWVHPVQKADAAYWLAEDALQRKEAQP